jgi:hypothetical protein
MNRIFTQLPLDLVINVINFGNVIKYRNGKFMNQIDKADERYKILQNISPIKTQFLHDEPWRYIRDLGDYYMFLYIDKSDVIIPRYRYTFQKKRKENDKSSITLYYHRIK